MTLMPDFPALKAAREERDQLAAEARTILNRSSEALSEDDAARFGEIETRLEALKATEQRCQRILHSLETGATEDGTPFTRQQEAPKRNPLAGARVLTREQRMTDWLTANGAADRDQEPVSFDRYLRGVVTGDWRNATAERALSEGTATAGGHTVPTPLAGQVIDLARNQMRVMQAGAVLVPMATQTLKVPRLTGEGSPGWRAENAAITPGDLTFDAVTFTAKSLDRLVILSRELFEDSDPSVSDIIAQSFAAQIALEMDRVALRGTGSSPEPRGVLNTSGVTTTAHGTNGTAITNYDWWLDAVGTVRAANFEPNAHIQAPRTNTSLSKLKEATTNAYLTPPVDMLPMLPTKQIPVNLTVGSSSDCTEVYTGDWSMLGIGIRAGFRLQFLTERYADNGQVAFIANLRGDVQVFQPAAFNVDVGVRA